MALLCRWRVGCSKLDAQAPQLPVQRPERQLQLRIQQVPCKRLLLLPSEKPQEPVRGFCGANFCIHLECRALVLLRQKHCFGNILLRGDPTGGYMDSQGSVAMLAGQPHRSLVFASQRGRAEVLPGPGTSYAPELAMSRPDVAPASLSPALEALDAAQPSQSFQTLEQPAVEPPASIRLEHGQSHSHMRLHYLHPNVKAV